MIERDSTPVSIFVNPAGQWDNIGDSVLRRAYLRSLRGRGRLCVLAPNEDYASGLGLISDDVIYRSKSAWLLGALRAAVHRKLDFAVNAGEFVGTRRELVRSIWQPLLGILARGTGGTVILAGASIRPGTSVWLSPLPILSRLSSYPSWRDSYTCLKLGRGEAQPDWAFALGGEDASDPGIPRDYLSVSFRGDRNPLSLAAVTEIMDLAVRLDVRIKVVVQVRRDQEASEILAARLGAELVSWPEEVDHFDHEATVRKVYRQSVATISDRIHALIIGATEGSTPVGFATGSVAKIERTFSGVIPILIVKEPKCLKKIRVRSDLSPTTAPHVEYARGRLANVGRAFRSRANS